jgi:hypothetical protein
MQPVIRDRPVSELPLVAWRCSGTRRDGRPCHQILIEYATAGPLALRKKCDRCNAWNTLTR